MQDMACQVILFVKSQIHKSPCNECMLHVKYGAVQSGSSGTGLEI